MSAIAKILKYKGWALKACPSSIVFAIKKSDKHTYYIFIAEDNNFNEVIHLYKDNSDNKIVGEKLSNYSKLYHIVD